MQLCLRLKINNCLHPRSRHDQPRLQPPQKDRTSVVFDHQGNGGTINTKSEPTAKQSKHHPCWLPSGNQTWNIHRL